MKQQVGPQAVWAAVKEKAPFWAEKLPEIPELIYDGLRQGRQVNQRLDTYYQGYLQTKRRHSRATYLLGIGATLLLTATILYANRIDTLPGIAASGAVIFWLWGWRLCNKTCNK